MIKKPINPFLDFYDTPDMIFNSQIFGGGAAPGPGLIASTKMAAANSGTSPGINTTGADLIVIVVADYQPAAASNISDSLGNIWTSLSISTAAPVARCRILYCSNPIVGAGHTFSATSPGSDTFPCIGVAAFSGYPLFDVDGSNLGGNGTVLDSGPVLPTGPCIVVAALSYLATSAVIDNGFTVIEVSNDLAGFRMGMAYKISTATSTKGTWSWSTPEWMASKAASFK